MFGGMLGLLGVLGCGNQAATPPTTTPGRVVIAFQSRGEGEIEPCG